MRIKPHLIIDKWINGPCTCIIISFIHSFPKFGSPLKIAREAYASKKFQSSNYIKDPEKGIGKNHSTWVTVKVNAIYAATEREVIHAKGAPNLYASMPDTIDIWKDIC